jgi:23S rRNA (pseudouridine1915-N3)-methyltransferase
MQIQLINVAQKLPGWVDAGCADYIKRLPRELGFSQVTVPLAAAASRQSANQRREREAAQILAKLRPGHTIALDDKGADWSSQDWSAQLQRWMQEYSQVNLVIGGPDGLAPQCLEICQQRVSLGRMTMPHALVKLVVLEQLYRAWTIYQGHPYHRE